MASEDIIYQSLILIVLFFIARYFLRRKVKRRAFTALEYMAIADRDGAYCRDCKTRLNLTLDHIKPISKGGSYHPSNLKILCGRCNSSKGNRT